MTTTMDSDRPTDDETEPEITLGSMDDDVDLATVRGIIVGAVISGDLARKAPIGSIIRTRDTGARRTKRSDGRALSAWSPRITAETMYEVVQVGSVPPPEGLTPEQVQVQAMLVEGAEFGPGLAWTYQHMPVGTVLADSAGALYRKTTDYGNDINAWEPAIDACCATYRFVSVPVPSLGGSVPPVPLPVPGEQPTQRQFREAPVGMEVSSGSVRWRCYQNPGSESRWRTVDIETGDFSSRSPYRWSDFDVNENMIVVAVPGVEADDFAIMQRRIKRRLLASGRSHGYLDHARAACVLLGMGDLGERDSIKVPVPVEGGRIDWFVAQWLPNAVIDITTTVAGAGLGFEEGWQFATAPDATDNADAAVVRMFNPRMPWPSRVLAQWVPLTGIELRLLNANGWTPPVYDNIKDLLDATWDLVERMRTAYSWCSAPLDELRAAGLDRIPDPPLGVGDEVDLRVQRGLDRLVPLPGGTILECGPRRRLMKLGDGRGGSWYNAATGGSAYPGQRNLESAVVIYIPGQEHACEDPLVNEARSPF